MLSLQLLLLCMPIVIYGYYTSVNALNIPMQDDYDAILLFLTKYKTLHGADKFWHLFVQHGEHRILSSRFVYVVYHQLFGSINFRHIILLGNLQLVAVYALCVYFIRKALPQHWFMASLVTSICLFDLNNWENADFAMACMQNYGVILWVFAATFLYSQQHKASLIAAILVQVVAIYSSGNGMIAMAFVVMFNLLRKDWLRTAVSASVLVICAPLYFVGYNTPPTGHPSTDVVKVGSYFFNVISAHASFDGAMLHIIAGVATLALYFAVLPVTKKLKIPSGILPLVCISGFVLASMLVAAVFRSNVAGVAPSSSRYMLYPNLLLAFVFIFFVYKFADRRFMKPAAIALLVVIACVYNMNMRGGRAGFDAFRAAKLDSKPFYPDTAVAQQILETSCKSGVYCIDGKK